MRILITGASGYLANTLLPMVAKDHHVIAIARKPWDCSLDIEFGYYDLSDEHDINQLLTEIAFDSVINAAAVNPGGDEQKMEPVNAVWPRFLAQYCQQNNIRLAHVSTDMVHNGCNAPYDDDAIPTANSRYGITKAKGEAEIRAHNPSAVIVRTSLIYGLKVMDRGTAGFIQQIEAGGTLKLFTDVIRQPCWDEDLADALLKLCTDKERVAGLINIAGSEAVNRYDFGVNMLRYWNQSVSNVEAVRAEDYAPSVPRDLRMVLDRAMSHGFGTTPVSEVLKKA